MSKKRHNFGVRGPNIRLRWLASVLAIFWLWSCEDGAGKIAASKSFLNISLGEASNAGPYAFQVDDIVIQDTIVYEGGDVASDVGIDELMESLDLRWGFRHKDDPDFVYWVQKNNSYEAEENMHYNQDVEDGEKTRFVPQDFPSALLQEQEANLELYAEASSGDEISAFGFMDLPTNFIDTLTRRVLIRGTVNGPNNGVRNASVYYVSEASAEIFQVFADDYGKYEIQVPNRRQFYQVVLAEGMKPFVKTGLLTVTEDISNADILVEKWPDSIGNLDKGVLYDARTLARSVGENDFFGKTLEKDGLKPLPGVTILLYDRAGDASGNLKFLLSDGKGEFRVKLHENSINCGYSAVIYGHSLVRESRNVSLQENLKVLRFEHNKGYTHPIEPAQLKTRPGVAYAVPANFQVGRVGRDSVELEWDAVANADHYRLSYGKGNSADEITAKVKKADGRVVFVVKNLDADTRYFFKVRSQGASREYGDYSDVKDATTHDVLAAPVNLKMVAGQNQSLALSWDSVANASGYEVSWGGDGAADGNSQSVNGTSYVLSGLSVGQGYFAKVRAKGDAKVSAKAGTTGRYADSAWSAVVDNDVTVALDVPANLKATVRDGNAFGLGVVDLAWSAVVNASGYEISYSAGAVPQTRTLQQTSLSLSGFKPNTLYSFKVRATGTGGYRNSNYSAEVRETTNQVSLPAPSVYALSNKARSVNLNIVLNRAASAFAKNYEISYGTDSNATGATKTIAGGSERALATMNGLKPNTRYFFKVRVLADANAVDSAYSSVVEVRTTKITLAVPKITLKADKNNPNQIFVEWNAVANASDYDVSWGTSAAADDERVASSATSIVLGSLQSDTQYYVKIQALAKADSPYWDSDWSRIRDARTLKLLSNSSSGIKLLRLINAPALDSSNQTVFGYRFVVSTGHEPLSGYEISYGTDKNASNGGSLKFAWPGSTADISGRFVQKLAYSTSYNIKVRLLGKDGYANSAYTAIKSFTSPADKPRMVAPQNIRLSQVAHWLGGQVVKAEWDAVPNAGGYTLYVGFKEGSGYNWTRSDDKNESDTEHEFLAPDTAGKLKFEAGTTYYVKMVTQPADPNSLESLDSVIVKYDFQ